MSLICVHDVLMSGSGKFKMFQKNKSEKNKNVSREKMYIQPIGPVTYINIGDPVKWCVYTIDPIDTYYVRGYVYTT